MRYSVSTLAVFLSMTVPAASQTVPATDLVAPEGPVTIRLAPDMVNRCTVVTKDDTEVTEETHFEITEKVGDRLRITIVPDANEPLRIRAELSGNGSIGNFEAAPDGVIFVAAEDADEMSMTIALAMKGAYETVTAAQRSFEVGDRLFDYPGYERDLEAAMVYAVLEEAQEDPSFEFEARLVSLDDRTEFVGLEKASGNFVFSGNASATIKMGIRGVPGSEMRVRIDVQGRSVFDRSNGFLTGNIVDGQMAFLSTDDVEPLALPIRVTTNCEIHTVQF